MLNTVKRGIPTYRILVDLTHLLRFYESLGLLSTDPFEDKSSVREARCGRIRPGYTLPFYSVGFK